MRKRAPVCYYGGKGNMVSKLLSVVPEGGRPYCEPYMGGASLFFSRKPAPVEVLNDLNEDLVNLFRVLQDPERFEEFRHRILFTLYSYSEFRRARRILLSSGASSIERAWALFVALNQGYSGTYQSDGKWSRTFFDRGGMAATTNKWLMRLSMLEEWHLRLLRVQIDCRDALEVLRYWDADEAVFYVDPPYVAATRVDKQAYSHEALDEHLAELVTVLLGLRGAAVLSGYAHPLFAPLEEAGWARIDWKTA